MSHQTLRFKKRVRDQQLDLTQRIIVIYSQKLTDKEHLTLQRISKSVMAGEIRGSDIEYIRAFEPKSKK